ncbi:hypothetical protein Tco_0893890 [Tanacetum coccineum]|uniref:Uncharacterized protein n=1 Tax=Tanacetum coccineum TaxID=301880 RepID=A0ABQ5CDB8_9ASTR
MHNNIKAAGSYMPSTFIILAKEATYDSLAVPERTSVETILNMSPENKEHHQSEKEAIHLLLTRIGDEIYSTVDACKIAHDMWIAIERLQQYPYYQAPKSRKSHAPPSKQSSSTRSHTSTKYKGKEIAKPITPPSELTSEEDSDSEQAQRDKDMQDNLALIAITSKRSTNIPTKTSELFQTLETRMQILFQGMQETKRAKDYTYHKEKMLLCKQAEKGIPLQAEQSDWLADTDEEIDEQELEEHYSYMAKTQEVPTTDLGTDTEPLEQVQYDTEYNVFANERQHSEKPESINNTCVVEKFDCNCAMLANLIVNLTLDTEENKKIIKKLKKANASLTQALKECKYNVEESNTTRDSCLIALQSKQTEIKTYKTLIDRTVDYDKLERKLNETLGLLAQKEIDIKEGLKLKAYEILVVKEKHNELVKQSFLTKSHYEGLVTEKT